MFKSMLTIIVSGTLATAALAQETLPPFTGVIAADDVYVRAGASQNYYPVGKLNTGDAVNVVELLYGWYGIQPPAGSFSFIAQQYVTLDADGVAGTITGDDVRVRAPSPAGPAQSYKIQLKLDKGAKVQVVGTEEDYYKIVPPAGALLYVHQDYLKPATPDQMTAVTPAAAAAAESATPPAAQTTTPTPAAEPTTTTATVAADTAAPTAEAAPPTQPVAETAPAQTASSDTTTPAPAPPQPARNYNAVGKLLASTIYTGDDMPLLYRLVDPQSGLTTAYIQPPDPYIMLPLLGKFVGVVGQSRYDPGMKLPIIHAKEFDALGPAS